MRPNRLLAIAGLLLAAGAFLAGGGPGPGAGAGVAELSLGMAEGAGTITAVELAEAIRSRRPLRIVDVRDSSEFIRLAVPTAEHASLPALPALAAGSPDSAELVLYDDGSGAAIRGWLLLRRLGHPRVRVLEGGVLGWIDGILEPVLPARTPAEREAYRRVAELSRYFGGRPRTGVPVSRPADPLRAGEAVRLISRRGCY